MNIIIDTNIFISALIKDGLTRKLILNSKDNLLFPEFEFEEISNNRREIMRKSGLSNKEFYTLLLRLIKYVKVIPKEIIIPYRKEANEIMRDIDENDAVFIASALCFDASIWTEDKHFKKQKRIKILTTQEIMERLL